MFGPRLRNVFRSRWHALWWSATILLTAYCSVPAADQVSHQAALEHPVHKHVNPWAKDGK